MTISTGREIPAHMPDFIAEHLKLYLESGGESGHDWNGVPCLLLKTIGRKSGEPLLLPLIYGTDGDDFVIVASKGGDARHPAWYLNLAANPDVELQVGTDHFHARARTASGDERDRLWAAMAAIWPAYNDYQGATDRKIPVVILTRA